ncbi:MAG: RNA 2',3'-cyclic phosphodiesterase [Deltaproteobacteria bacterium]|jgi:2'-5' RNA ligase|nr:RNA 2',3'-cyclic phosphodiesterase [Deltaproteobacteria bacterium]
MVTEAPPPETALKARLFAAVPVPDEAARRFLWLRGRTGELESLPLRNLHVNVRFIGEVDTETVPLAMDAVGLASSCGPFTLSLKGLFIHPSANAYLLCARVEDHAPLAALKNACDAALDPLPGIPAPLNRPFRPSMLIARLKTPPSEELLEIVAKSKNRPIANFQVESLSLFQSRLSPDGATHTEIAKVPLEGAPYVPRSRPRPKPKGKPIGNKPPFRKSPPGQQGPRDPLGRQGPARHSLQDVRGQHGPTDQQGMRAQHGRWDTGSPQAPHTRQDAAIPQAPSGTDQSNAETRAAHSPVRPRPNPQGEWKLISDPDPDRPGTHPPQPGPAASPGPEVAAPGPHASGPLPPEATPTTEAHKPGAASKPEMSAEDPSSLRSRASTNPAEALEPHGAATPLTSSSPAQSAPDATAALSSPEGHAPLTTPETAIVSGKGVASKPKPPVKRPGKFGKKRRHGPR